MLRLNFNSVKNTGHVWDKYGQKKTKSGHKVARDDFKPYKYDIDAQNDNKFRPKSNLKMIII